MVFEYKEIAAASFLLYQLMHEGMHRPTHFKPLFRRGSSDLVLDSQALKVRLACGGDSRAQDLAAIVDGVLGEGVADCRGHSDPPDDPAKCMQDC